MNGSMVIRLKAAHVEFRNGIAEIEVPATTMTAEQDAVLNDLFPNLRHKVERLIVQEAVLEAIVE